MLMYGAVDNVIYFSYLFVWFTVFGICAPLSGGMASIRGCLSKCVTFQQNIASTNYKMSYNFCMLVHECFYSACISAAKKLAIEVLFL